MPQLFQQNIRPRAIWPHESRDFTPWLADNLPFLARALNMELELEAREKNVGGFRADLVCRNKADNSRIVIENQLDRSDHSHLGQVLTYAAGLQAVTIAWLATEFRNPHRVTLDWHNEITDARFKFFGLELYTWKDTASSYTAQLPMISKPDGWLLPEEPVLYQIHIATQRVTD